VARADWPVPQRVVVYSGCRGVSGDDLVDKDDISSRSGCLTAWKRLLRWLLIDGIVFKVSIYDAEVDTPATSKTASSFP